MEYLQNSVLQQCNRKHAVGMTDRMAIASFQAVAAGGGADAEVEDHEVTNLGKAWYYATSYYAWLYRMQARLMLQDTVLGMIGNVGADEESHPALNMPLPLAWKGKTDYNNTFNAPQSEAGLWSALALQRYMAHAAVEDLFSQKVDNTEWTEPPLNDTTAWQSACGATGLVPGCPSHVAQMALRRIEKVKAAYEMQKVKYETMLTEVLAFEVRAARALASGALSKAMKLSAQASGLEAEAVKYLLPSSTSLYFLPGTAFHGVMAYRMSSSPWAMEAGSQKELLQSAAASFDECLSPQGRPNLAVCLLGKARVATQQAGGECTKTATAAYKQLRIVWLGSEVGKPAREGCTEAWAEAANYLMQCVQPAATS